MSGKGVAILVGIGVVLVIGAGRSIYNAGVESEEKRTATLIALRAGHVADSLVALYEARFDSAKKATAATIKAKDQAVNVAARQTNQALAAGNQASESANKLLADTSATLGQLRGALREASSVIDSMSTAFQAERIASQEARLARDSSHAQEVRLVRQGFTATIAAKDSAALAVARAFRADLAQARGSGLRRGRVEGVVVGSLLVGAIVHFVKP